MPTELKPEELRKLYLALPQDVRDAIFSVDTARSLEEIAKKHGLHIDKLDVLATAVSEIMLAIASPHGFGKRLQDGLGVDAAKAADITKDINERVFKPIRESLMKIHKKAGHLEHEVRDTKYEARSTEREVREKSVSEAPEDTLRDAQRPSLPPEVEKMLETAPEVPPQKATGNEQLATGKKLEAGTQTPEKIPPIFQKQAADAEASGNSQLATSQPGASGKKLGAAESELRGSYNDKDPYREPIG